MNNNEDEVRAHLKVEADQCILWCDRVLKQWHEHPDEPLSNFYWEQYKTRDWFGYHVLDVLVVYTRSFDTPRNRQDAPFFELKHEIFTFQHNLIVQVLQIKINDPVLGPQEQAGMNHAETCQRFITSMGTYVNWARRYLRCAQTNEAHSLMSLILHQFLTVDYPRFQHIHQYQQPFFNLQHYQL